ncbi:universal stress protein [Microbacterium sp. P5_E9]
MERIVLGYDGSPAAVSALDWTAARAVPGHTSVDVVLVASPLYKERAIEWQRLGRAQALLDERVPGLDVAVHRLEGGVTDSIARASDEADLVVVGINPGHPIRAAAGGWMPLRLSTRSEAPVCMIPVGWRDTDDPVTVGIGSDESSDAALDFAAAEALRSSTDLRLVHSWLMPAPALDASTVLAVTPEEVIEDNWQDLEGAAQRVLIEHPNLSVQSELIRDSRSAALLRFDGRSSLIVIGTHRRGVLVGSLLGSVGQEILWRAECPICVVPPHYGVPATSVAARPGVRAGR